MFANHRPRRLAFTLVEMLVVLGIIGVLIAILLPVIGSALVTTRNARMAIEIAQLRDAVEAYKNAHGDYPPSMGQNYSAMTRSSTHCERHLQRCYPKMTPTAKAFFYDNIAPRLDQGEALVFFLSQTTADVTNPFNTSPYNSTAAKQSVYDFKPQQLKNDDNDNYTVTGPSGSERIELNSYRGAYSKDASYVYIDSRHYGLHNNAMNAAKQENGVPETLKILPYATRNRMGNLEFINPSSFQILCAGQDGEFSASGSLTAAREFPSGVNYSDEERDNITSFSEGKTLGNSIPQ